MSVRRAGFWIAGATLVVLPILTAGAAFGGVLAGAVGAALDFQPDEVAGLVFLAVAVASTFTAISGCTAGTRLEFAVPTDSRVLRAFDVPVQSVALMRGIIPIVLRQLFVGALTAVAVAAVVRGTSIPLLPVATAIFLISLAGAAWNIAGRLMPPMAGQGAAHYLGVGATIAVLAWLAGTFIVSNDFASLSKQVADLSAAVVAATLVLPALSGAVATAGVIAAVIRWLAIRSSVWAVETTVTVSRFSPQLRPWQAHMVQTALVGRVLQARLLRRVIFIGTLCGLVGAGITLGAQRPVLSASIQAPTAPAGMALLVGLAAVVASLLRASAGLAAAGGAHRWAVEQGASSWNIAWTTVLSLTMGAAAATLPVGFGLALITGSWNPILLAASVCMAAAASSAVADTVRTGRQQNPDGTSEPGLPGAVGGSLLLLTTLIPWLLKLPSAQTLSLIAGVAVLVFATARTRQELSA